MTVSGQERGGKAYILGGGAVVAMDFGQVYDATGGDKMIGSSGHVSTARIVVIGGLVLLLCAVGLTACGRGGGRPSMAVVASEEEAEIGKAIQAQAWEVMVTKPSEKLSLVGKGDITYRAEGIYVILPLKVTNLGEEVRMIPRELLRLKDTQGREFEATQSAIQIAYILPKGMELLLDSPMASGVTRESVIIYDVPTDATGLEMTMEGTEETLDLGF